MVQNNSTKISVVSPVYRGEKMVPELVRRNVAALTSITDDYEIILVNDASPDESWNEIIKECERNPRVKGLNLSRNFGQHYAITAGLSYATGDWIVVMDCDLQDRPEEIPNLYKKAQEGYDIVFARRVVKHVGWWKRFSSVAFHAVIDWLSGTKSDPAIANFGIYCRKAIDEYNKIPQQARAFGQILDIVGFKRGYVDVEQDASARGESSYTFVSTALAFLREGAKVVFADSMKRHPNLDAETIESLITPRTKVIVPVHYAGVACDMDKIMEIANRHNLLVVEDAAQAIDSYYTSNIIHQTLPLGGIGHLAAFSFHETKNITAGGEGGLLVVNDERCIRRAEIIWEKGTNRAEFFRGEVNKYGWVDMGSSFLPAEINAAFLWAQLENLDEIQAKRKSLWETYYELLTPLADKHYFTLPDIPDYASNNAHMFYLILPNLEKRSALIQYLKNSGIMAVFHYLSLHSSQFYKDKHDGRTLPECDRYADALVRLPMYYDLEIEDVERICRLIQEMYNV